jgi:hypothetical protein
LAGFLCRSYQEEDMFKFALVVGASLCVLGSATMAEVPAAAKECANDIKTLCAGVQPGEGRAAACIKEHFEELSAPCQGIVLKAAAVGKACSADIKKLCVDVKPGEGRIEACLKSHISEISEPCREAAAQAKG